MTQQYPPQYPPQAGQPQQAPAYPQQQAPQGYAPAPYQGQPPPQQAQAPVPPPVASNIGAPASYYVGSPEEVERQMEQRQRDEQRGGGSRKGYLRIPGPDGSSSWESAQSGYKGHVDVYLMPPSVQGVGEYVDSGSHFWKSAATGWKPKSLTCVNEDTCKVCLGRRWTYKTGGRPDSAANRRNKYLYQVAALGTQHGPIAPHEHIDTDDQERPNLMKPFLMEVPKKLHVAIQELIKDRIRDGLLYDPVNGRPIRLMRKKTGPEAMNVEYSVMDLNKAPLPQEYAPVLSALYDLRTIAQEPDEATQYQAAEDIGVPLMAALGQPLQGPPPVQQGQPGAYQQGHQAPGQSPYQAAPPPTYQPQQQAPQAYPPQPQAYQPQQQAPAYQQAPPSYPPQQQAAPPPPAQPSVLPQPTAPTNYEPQASGQAAPVGPPPVVQGPPPSPSSGTVAPPPPPPGASVAPPPPPPGAGAVAAPPPPPAAAGAAPPPAPAAVPSGGGGQQSLEDLQNQLMGA